jgi:hypothetical protein
MRFRTVAPEKPRNPQQTQFTQQRRPFRGTPSSRYRSPTSLQKPGSGTGKHIEFRDCGAIRQRARAHLMDSVNLSSATVAVLNRKAMAFQPPAY